MPAHKLPTLPLPQGWFENLKLLVARQFEDAHPTAQFVHAKLGMHAATFNRAASTNRMTVKSLTAICQRLHIPTVNELLDKLRDPAAETSWTRDPAPSFE